MNLDRDLKESWNVVCVLMPGWQDGDLRMTAAGKDPLRSN